MHNASKKDKCIDHYGTKKNPTYYEIKNKVEWNNVYIMKMKEIGEQ